MKDFRNVKVWERAHALTLRVYRKTAKFPDNERSACRDLAGEIVEIKRMLSAFIKKLKADR